MINCFVTPELLMQTFYKFNQFYLRWDQWTLTNPALGPVPIQIGEMHTLSMGHHFMHLKITIGKGVQIKEGSD